MVTSGSFGSAIVFEVLPLDSGFRISSAAKVVVVADSLTGELVEC